MVLLALAQFFSRNGNPAVSVPLTSGLVFQMLEWTACAHTVSPSLLPDGPIFRGFVCLFLPLEQLGRQTFTNLFLPSLRMKAWNSEFICSPSSARENTSMYCLLLMMVMMVTSTAGFCTSEFIHCFYIFYIAFLINYIVNVHKPPRYVGEALLLLLPLFR